LTAKISRVTLKRHPKGRQERRPAEILEGSLTLNLKRPEGEERPEDISRRILALNLNKHEG
jgi:hypothetical protein